MNNAEFDGNYFVGWGLALLLAGSIFMALSLIKSKILSQTPPKNLALHKTYDLIQGIFQNTGRIFFLAVSLYFGSFLLNLPDSIADGLGNGVFLILLGQVGWWGTWWIGRWAKSTFNTKRESDSAQASAIGLLKILGQTVLWAFLILAGLSNIGFEVSTLIAGLGVGGIAIALASQKILGDLFASLTIILDRPFLVGDFIISNDILGNVEVIGLKTTHIRSLEGELLIISNSDLLESRLRNFQRMEERRAKLNIGVIYQTPLEKLKSIPQMVQEIIESQEQTRFVRAHFKEYGSYSLNFEIVFFVTSREYKVYMDILQEVNLQIFERFENEKIEFAYPSQTVFIDERGKESKDN